MIPRSGEVRARGNIGVAGQRYFVDPENNILICRTYICASQQ